MPTITPTREVQVFPGATYQDVLDAPPHKIAEIIDGSLYVSPLPAPRHALALTVLAGNIGLPFSFSKDGPGGWWVLNKPELHLDDDVLVPDIVGWRRDRMPKLPDVAYFTQVPDWACEILSSWTRKLDLYVKRAVYARNGVTHLWFVDPDVRTLETFELRDGQWLLLNTLKDNDPVSLPPFEAISFSLGDLWPYSGEKSDSDHGKGVA